MNKVFVLFSSADKEVHNEASFKYAYNAKKQNWFEKVRVILWGPPERMAVEDSNFNDQIKQLLKVGVEVFACKACSDSWGLSDNLTSLGVKVEYVGTIITAMLKDNWKQLTF